MSRREARDTAFKLIFEIPFHGCNYKDRIDFFIEHIDVELSESDKEYVKKCVSVCFENLSDIDDKVTPLLNKWTLSRLPKVSLSILRLGVAEMIYFDEIPYQVSINEAVELAKAYGDDDAPAFINGVLDKIAKQ